MSSIIVFLNENARFYELLIICYLILSGFLIRLSLIICGQNWVKSYHHLATYMLLPPIAFVITIIISNNIALSLGMIGALSIVRFRHPVKSQLELAIFFALITIGIAAGASIDFSIMLLLVTIFIPLLIQSLNLIKKFFKINISFTQISFNEGESLNILEVDSYEKIDLINKISITSSSNYNKTDNMWSYKFMFKEKKDLILAQDEFIKNYNIAETRSQLNN